MAKCIEIGGTEIKLGTKTIIICENRDLLALVLDEVLWDLQDEDWTLSNDGLSKMIAFRNKTIYVGNELLDLLHTQDINDVYIVRDIDNKLTCHKLSKLLSEEQLKQPVSMLIDDVDRIIWR